jgi:hypothetical protein
MPVNPPKPDFIRLAPQVVTLNAVKGLALRFFAEPVLSVVEGLRMTELKGHRAQCTKVMHSGLERPEFFLTFAKGSAHSSQK